MCGMFRENKVGVDVVHLIGSSRAPEYCGVRKHSPQNGNYCCLYDIYVWICAAYNNNTGLRHCDQYRIRPDVMFWLVSRVTIIQKRSLILHFRNLTNVLQRHVVVIECSVFVEVMSQTF